VWVWVWVGLKKKDCLSFKKICLSVWGWGFEVWVCALCGGFGDICGWADWRHFQDMLWWSGSYDYDDSYHQLTGC